MPPRLHLELTAKQCIPNKSTHMLSIDTLLDWCKPIALILPDDDKIIKSAKGWWLMKFCLLAISSHESESARGSIFSARARQDTSARTPCRLR